MSGSLLLKCPACARDTWQGVSERWNVWECLSCGARTRLSDGIMDLSPDQKQLPGLDDKKMCKILGISFEDTDALDP